MASSGKRPLTIAVAQINPTVGDIAGNAAKIISFYKKVKADLVVFPELALIGYPPEDLVLMPAFQKESMQALARLARVTRNGPAMIVGSLWQEQKKIYNAAIVMERGKIAFVQKKIKLPNYGVFDEKRIFSAGDVQKVWRYKGVKIGLLVCEDLWSPETSKNLKKQGAELLISLNASPFENEKMATRRRVAARVAKENRLPVLYVNLVGGQDDLVFDGGSFLTYPSPQGGEGRVGAIIQLPKFSEHLALVEYTPHGSTATFRLVSPAPPQGGSKKEERWAAMRLGLADYVRKNGFTDVVLGLSGGVDSALTAAVAVDALGAAHVHGVLLPSPYTSRESTEDALALARNLGIETITIPITEAMQTCESMLGPVMDQSGWMEQVGVGGNLQARLRGVLLMALSNRYGWMLLSTGNKSEIAVGYTTLYGDACGSYNVLKDLYKTDVYRLARTCSAIPPRVLTKAPTAELAPGQKDSDQLPPYETLDAILTLHIEQRLSLAEIVRKGYAKKTVERVLGMVRQSEYKRRQSCPGVKLSPMLFGKDRRYPLTRGDMS